MTNQDSAQLQIYHISQQEQKGYDTYSDAVVAAYSKAEARRIHPLGDYVGGYYYDEKERRFRDKGGYTPTVWASTISKIKCVELGTAGPKVQPGIICSSFHVG